MGRGEKGPLPSAPPPLRPSAETNGHPPGNAPQLLRARHVMALLGVGKRDLHKFIECDLLTPRYLPDPHRTGRRNVKKHQRAWFLAVEVQSIVANLKPEGANLKRKPEILSKPLPSPLTPRASL